MDQDNRHILADRIQVAPGRMALVSQHGIVVTPAHQPLAFSGWRTLQPVGQCPLNAGNTVGRARGWRIGIHHRQLRSRQDCMTVGIEKSGHQGLTLEVFEDKVATVARLDPRPIATHGNTTILHRNRLHLRL